MKSTDFCHGWTYRLWGVPGDTPVTLPHDFSQRLPRTPESKSGAAGGFFQGANIIYDKAIEVTEDMLDRRVLLDFEGVFPNAEVYLDDALIARQMYGYISFFADLTPRLRLGTRKLRVNVHGDALPNSRWYMGTGICRPVYLLTGPKAGIEPNGIFLKTTRIDGGKWRLDARVSVTEEAVGKTLRLGFDGRAACAPIESAECSVSMDVKDVQPWSPDAPNLVDAVVEVLDGGAVVDRRELRFGFREIALDREKGLLLNGEPIKLRGGCVHHDNGLLGAESTADAEYRKAKLLRDMGFNAVRCAHNPPAPAFLDACDALGLMVMDEFADMWNIGKNPYDYHLHFAERWRDDLAAMIRRDRNHPSVVMWSIGNEIPERDGSGDGYRMCAEMAELVRGMDDTRPVTAALNNIGRRRLDMLAANVQADDPEDIDYFAELSAPFLAPLDVAGYNYLARRYAGDLRRFPERFICGTESVAKEALECWRGSLENPRVIGDFAWAAIDYLGEAGIGHIWRSPEDGQGYFERWPWRQANCADIDLCGEMNPSGYYRQAVWGTLEAPYIAVQHPAHFNDDGEVSYWAWPERWAAWDYPGYEDKPVRVDVYSAAESVTLTLNGRTIGTKRCADCVASFELPYEPGILEARDQRGHRVLRTPGPAARLVIETLFRGAQLQWLRAGILDENGVPCVFDHREIAFACEGGEVLAVGSADPSSEETFRAGRARAWRGSVCAVVRPGTNAALSVRAQGLPEAFFTSFR